MEHLSIKEIHDRLQELHGWEMTGNEIIKEFQFKDVKEARDFANNVGEEAEREQHQPEIVIKSNKVTIILTTPDENGLTYKDFKLAKIIEQLI